jgi:hypothetical protein
MAYFITVLFLLCDHTTFPLVSTTNGSLYFSLTTLVCLSCHSSAFRVILSCSTSKHLGPSYYLRKDHLNFSTPTAISTILFWTMVILVRFTTNLQKELLLVGLTFVALLFFCANILVSCAVCHTSVSSVWALSCPLGWQYYAILNHIHWRYIPLPVLFPVPDNSELMFSPTNHSCCIFPSYSVLHVSSYDNLG